MFSNSKRVFLDYASTTPVDEKVFSAMKPYFTDKFTNPSSLYEEGLEVREVLENQRKLVSSIVQVKPSEVIFTGSGTESDNLGIIGVARAVAKKEKIKNPHVITTNIEHVAVIESCKRLEEDGFEVTYIPVDKEGVISVEDVKNALRPETVLVSVMLANNEIGTVFPVRQIGVLINRYKKDEGRIASSYPYLHSDASQSPNYLDTNVDRLGVDLLTLDGSKIYGPKGVGCLISKSYVPIERVICGGGQESGLRAGTENVASIVGFAKALEITSLLRDKEVVRIKKIQDHFIKTLQKEIPKIQINGSLKNRLPNNVNICIEGLNAEFAVVQLDNLSVAVAAMTACKNLAGETSSYVVDALGNGCGKSSLRFTLGRESKKGDVRKAVDALKKVIELQKI